MSSAREHIQSARIRSSHTRMHPYLASALYAMRLVETNRVPTMGVDASWNCYYNPQTILGWTVEETCTVLEHEVWHLLRKHHERRPSTGPKGVALGNGAIQKLWNVATDCEINDDLVKSGKLPGNPCLPKDYGLQDGRIAEEYYDQLPPENLRECGYGGSGSDGVPREWEDQPGHITKVERDIIIREVARKIKESVGRGSIPDGMQRWADEVLRPPIIPWNRELMSILKGHMASFSGRTDVTYARRHRRQSSFHPIIRPASYRLLPNIVVVVDTSGSISDAMLGQALSETRAILKAIEGACVTVISCDAAVHTTQRIFSDKQIRFAGNGGTDMTVGIQAALKLKPNILILITDGFTPYPATIPAPNIRFVTVILTKEGDAPSYGKVVRVNTPLVKEAAA